MAKNVSITKDTELDFSSLFKKPGDRKLADKLLHKYLEQFAIENIAEKSTLKQLIFLEVVQEDLEKQINKFRDDGALVPDKMLDVLHRNLREIKDLKNQLGIKKKDEDKSDAFKALETMMDKAKKWREKNPNRTMKCPYCQEMVLLKMKTEAYDALKHPFYQDRYLFNKHAFRLMYEGKISKMDVARILEDDYQSEDFVEWLEKKINPRVLEELGKPSNTGGNEDKKS